MRRGGAPAQRLNRAETPPLPGNGKRAPPILKTSWLSGFNAIRRATERKDAVKRLIDKDVTPQWKYRQVPDLGRRDVLDIIDAVVDRGSPITARRLHAYLHRFFNWCAGRGIIAANPMLNMEKPGSETARDRVLRGGELADVWKAAVSLGWPFGDAIRLLILTGARRQEIAGLRWAEIHNGSIELPGDRTKNAEPHTIPLSTAVQTILAHAPRIAKSEFVLTTNGTAPISGWTKTKAEIDKSAGIAPWTIHDLRRTASTGMNELGTDPHIVEAVLGHKVKGVAGVYNKAKYEAAKRIALEAWGAHVTALVEGAKPGKVLPMRGKR